MITLVTILSIASILDVRTGRIPNKLILLSLLTGYGYQIFLYGIQAIPQSILGMLFPVILLFPIFIVKGLGAGDVKLIAVIGCFLTIAKYQTILTLIFLALLFGAVQALLLTCLHRRYQSTIHFSIPILVSTLCYIGGIY